MKQEKSAYITSVHLKGYKSIRDVSVTLNKGLNILIGANGSGKTNFLEFLDAAYRSDYEILLNGRKFECSFVGNPFSKNIAGEKLGRSEFKGIAYRVKEDVNYLGGEGFITYFFDENRKFVNREIDAERLSDFQATIQILYPILLLKFENPLTQILKEKLNLYLSFSIEGDDSEAWYHVGANLKNGKKPYSFLNKIFVNSAIDEKENIDETYILKEVVENRWFLTNNLQQNLKQFSPIKDFKIDWALTRQTIPDYDDVLLIEGIDFQFYVNNEWINWTQLSDGTKRLFYLIGSVTYATENEIILIEEPELGVHPHQLALLMNFLKSESEDKQIIISTHSPQVLNCLKGEELDRIIVARHEGKAGTKLYHLSEEEKGYASAYMINEAFLSDYWMLSGFMNEEPTENA
jgi:energy-coupling factor transporter ATP-binding protein EcfA2